MQLVGRGRRPRPAAAQRVPRPRAEPVRRRGRRRAVPRAARGGHRRCRQRIAPRPRRCDTRSAARTISTRPGATASMRARSASRGPRRRAPSSSARRSSRERARALATDAPPPARRVAVPTSPRQRRGDPRAGRPRRHARRARVRRGRARDRRGADRGRQGHAARLVMGGSGSATLTISAACHTARRASAGPCSRCSPRPATTGSPPRRRGAFDYERSWMDPGSGAWPDLRVGGQRRGAARTLGSAATGTWCHGEGGIALTRLRASGVLGGERGRRRRGACGRDDPPASRRGPSLRARGSDALPRRCRVGRGAPLRRANRPGQGARARGARPPRRRRRLALRRGRRHDAGSLPGAQRHRLVVPPAPRSRDRLAGGGPGLAVDTAAPTGVGSTCRSESPCNQEDRDAPGRSRRPPRRRILR